ncbi:hypothetical protein TP46_12130 [Xanthomonas citri pv. aurantifolii]|nr:hypothetical protein TP46_12130 [Xanthomonas citri pv. aurantifolii]
MVAIPRPQAAIADRAGLPTREWYTYLLDLANSAGMTPAQREQLEQLIARVTALEGSGGSSGSLSVQGLGSIIVNGVDIVQIYLDGDSDAPGPSWYYGSGPDGAKGWYAIADSLAVTSDLTKAVDAGTGVATLGLGDLPDSGAGAALRKITRDSKGRLAGTSAATTDDLPESGTPTNQWFTAARVRAVALTGLATAVNAAIAATDSVLAAFGKLQAQITGLGTSKADKTTTISTTAPLGGGGDLSANRTLTISAATTSAAGSMSAADKVLLDGIVAWSPSALAGLVLIYVSGTSLTVSAGACHIQSLGRVLVFPWRSHPFRPFVERQHVLPRLCIPQRIYHRRYRACDDSACRRLFRRCPWQDWGREPPLSRKRVDRWGRGHHPVRDDLPRTGELHQSRHGRHSVSRSRK